MKVLTKKELAGMPLRDRTKRRGVGFVRLTPIADGHALIKVLRATAKLPFALQGSKPLIFCADEQLSLELMVRSYGEHLLPLLGEVRLARASLSAARSFGADSALCDIDGALTLLSDPPSSVKQIYVLTEGVSSRAQLARVGKASVPVHLFFSLPETGIIGELCQGASLVLHKSSLVSIRYGDGILYVDSHDQSYAAPLRNYQTGIRISKEQRCDVCGEAGYALL